MTVRASYHTIVFAPDTLDPDGGPSVQIAERGLSGIGVQSTLPVDDPEPVLYDHRDTPIYFANARPARRSIGFRAR